MSTDNRDYVCIIPERVMFDLSLTLLDVRLYGLVSSFMYTTGKFYEGNKKMAARFGVEMRSIPRSIARLILRGYLDSKEINGKRHLMIRQTPLEESIVSCSEHDTNVTPPMTPVSPPHDTHVTQSVLPITTIELASATEKKENLEPGIDLPFVLNQAKELGLSESIIIKTITSKGLGATSKALALYAKRSPAPNPYAWVNKCIRDKYWEEGSNAYSDDIFRASQPKYTCMDKLEADAKAALEAQGIIEPVWDKEDPNESYERAVAYNFQFESKKQSLNVST